MIPFPMLFGYIIFVVLSRKCTISIISFWLKFPSILAVVGLLDAFSVFGCPIANLCQGLVVVGIGVDIGISAVPNESSFLFEAVFVVDEAGKGKRIGQGRLKVISDNLDILLGLDPTYAC